MTAGRHARDDDASPIGIGGGGAGAGSGSPKVTWDNGRLCCARGAQNPAYPSKAQTPASLSLVSVNDSAKVRRRSGTGADGDADNGGGGADNNAATNGRPSETGAVGDDDDARSFSQPIYGQRRDAETVD